MLIVTLRPLLLLIPLWLTGCSQAPSEADITLAYQKEVANTNAMTSKLGGQELAIKVNTVKKVDCAENGDTEQYTCQVEIDSTLPFVGQRKEATELTLSKSENGWAILRGLSRS
jgi:hypothetical protein